MYTCISVEINDMYGDKILLYSFNDSLLISNNHSQLCLCKPWSKMFTFLD